MNRSGNTVREPGFLFRINGLGAIREQGTGNPELNQTHGLNRSASNCNPVLRFPLFPVPLCVLST